MSSNAQRPDIPNGLYTIRVAGVNTEANYVTAVSRDGIRGYDLKVKEQEKNSLWVIQWTGDGDNMMIYPRWDAICSCTALTPKELAAIPPGSVDHRFSVWVFLPTEQKNTYFISQIGIEPGVLNNWTWEGEIDVPVSLSLGSKSPFTLELRETQ